jgi:xanthine dehydrogenase YagT iron-sulfur-binding subunit
MPHIKDSAGTAAQVESQAPTTISFRLNVNGQDRNVALDPRTTLLDALRDHLDLTGSKKGCDHGQCGACTVLIDGRRELSCLSLAIARQNSIITTIEGLAEGETLHAMQEAFLECDGFQCGYCTPGQILSAIGMLEEAKAYVPSHVTPDVLHAPGPDDLSDDEIRERMSGNICRCGAYPNIVAAVRHAHAVKGGR